MRDMRLKRLIKMSVAHALYGLGLLQLWQRWQLRNRAVVLMYHRVLDDEQWDATGSNPGMSVRLATFERQVALLRQRFVPLSLERFVEHVAHRRPFPTSACLVTFDDGWRDTMTNAVPVLQQHGVPVSVFLPTAFIGTRRMFMREALTHLAVLARARATDPQLAAPLRQVLQEAGLAAVLTCPEAEARATAVTALGAAPINPAMQAVVQKLSGLLGVTPEQLDTPDTFMTWPDVASLAKAGVAFGGHGAEHRLLGTLNADEVETEVAQSRAALATVAPPVWAFSYPNGSCSPAVAEQVRRHGYQVAFTIESGAVACDDDAMLLRRMNISEAVTDSTPMFLARLVGLF